MEAEFYFIRDTNVEITPERMDYLRKTFGDKMTDELIETFTVPLEALHEAV